VVQDLYLHGIMKLVYFLLVRGRSNWMICCEIQQQQQQQHSIFPPTPFCVSKTVTAMPAANGLPPAHWSQSSNLWVASVGGSIWEKLWAVDKCQSLAEKTYLLIAKTGTLILEGFSTLH
jgi:hypothetical protein